MKNTNEIIIKIEIANRKQPISCNDSSEANNTIQPGKPKASAIYSDIKSGANASALMEK
jgi:hypothetical protein